MSDNPPGVAGLVDEMMVDPSKPIVGPPVPRKAAEGPLSVQPKALNPPGTLVAPRPVAATPVSRPLPVAADKRDIAFCLPWYKTTNPHTVFSLLSLFDKTQMGLKMQVGDAMIVHSRNIIADWFLKSKHEWSLWVDDDMVLPTGNPGWFRDVTDFRGMDDVTAGRNTVDRIRASGKTFVGATYFGRNKTGRPMFAEAVGNKKVAAEVRKAPRDEVRATAWVGTGCVLIHRSVFEAIQRKFPELAPPSAGDVWQFFSPSQDVLFRAAESLEKLTEPEEIKAAAAGLVRHAREYHPGTGEDVIFSRRAFAAGHQPYVDLGLVVGHLGAACYGPTNTIT